MSRKILQFCFIAALTVACSEEEPRKALTVYDESLIEYFNEVALGFELVVHRKLPENGQQT